MARPRRIDLTGQEFGKLTVIHEAEPYICISKGTKERKWFCECSCGKEVSVKQNNLRSGKTKSCGCLKVLNFTRGK